MGRPLWASTGRKDPAYSDVRYVEQLVAPGVINTMPEKTLRTFAEHDGVAAFCDSYRQLLRCIESKLGSLSAVA